MNENIEVPQSQEELVATMNATLKASGEVQSEIQPTPEPGADIPVAPEDVEEIRQLQKQINDAHTNLGILEVQYETERTKFLKQLEPLKQQMELSQRRLAMRYKIPPNVVFDLDAGVVHLPK